MMSMSTRPTLRLPYLMPFEPKRSREVLLRAHGSLVHPHRHSLVRVRRRGFLHSRCVPKEPAKLSSLSRVAVKVPAKAFG